MSCEPSEKHYKHVSIGLLHNSLHRHLIAEEQHTVAHVDGMRAHLATRATHTEWPPGSQVEAV